MGGWWPVSVKARDWKTCRITGGKTTSRCLGPSLPLRSQFGPRPRQRLAVSLAVTRHDQPSFHEVSTKDGAKFKNRTIASCSARVQNAELKSECSSWTWTCQVYSRVGHKVIIYLKSVEKNVPFRGQILSVKKCLAFILIPTYGVCRHNKIIDFTFYPPKIFLYQFQLMKK